MDIYINNTISTSTFMTKVAEGEHSPAYYLAPVSYTHLRAHETVLDLVCRLLLEKNRFSIGMGPRSIR